MRRSLLADGLLADLEAVGELGDDSVAEAARRIAPLVVRAATSRVLDVLSELAADLSAELPEGRVELRVAGDEVTFAHVLEQGATAPTDGDLTARITLRLSESLKQAVEAKAADASLSLNAWIVRALERRATSTERHDYRATRLHGYGTA
ncbi:MAG: toxin-antitoxin system HicB family antitoxin [Acidimicrobiales bacterium]